MTHHLLFLGLIPWENYLEYQKFCKQKNSCLAMLENTDYNYLYTALFAVVFTLNGFVIPFSYSMISDKYKEYSDRFFFDKFIKTDEFQTNFYTSMTCAALFLIPVLLNVNIHIDNQDFDLIRRLKRFREFYLVLTIIVLIKFLVDFIRFSLLLYEYVTNTDEIIFEQIREKTDEYFSE